MIIVKILLQDSNFYIANLIYAKYSTTLFINLNFIIMKNLLFFFFFATLFSCSKDDTTFDLMKNETMKFSESEKSTYNEIITLDDLDDQKLALAALTPEERHSIWQQKIINYIENNKNDDEQLKFLHHLLYDFDVNAFTFNSKERNELLEKKDDYYKKSMNLFGNIEGAYFLNNIENINQSVEKIKINNNISLENENLIDNNIQRPISPCNCIVNSDCIRLVGFEAWGLSWEYGDCDLNKICTNNPMPWYFSWFGNNNIGKCQFNGGFSDPYIDQP